MMLRRLIPLGIEQLDHSKLVGLDADNGEAAPTAVTKVDQEQSCYVRSGQHRY